MLWEVFFIIVWFADAISNSCTFLFVFMSCQTSSLLFEIILSNLKLVELTLQKKIFLRKSVKKGNNEQSHKCIRKTLFLRSIVALFLPIFQRLEDELQKTLAEFQEKVSIVFEKSGVTTSPDYVFCFRLASLLEE